MRILITGGSGFIGSALIRKLILDENIFIGNIDKQTYASHSKALINMPDDRYMFWKIDISNIGSVREIFSIFKPDAVINLAAETHVDKSINNPQSFILSNILGAFHLLEVAKEYWLELGSEARKNFRFIHISTDEIYGDLFGIEKPANENCVYRPSSPYSASKASADHLVRSWNRTYGIPTIITASTNNYGPFQNTEKLIPKVITKVLNKEKISIYGDGLAIRNWLYVDDHVDGLLRVLFEGVPSETYNIAGDSQISNIQLVEKIFKIIELLSPVMKKSTNSFQEYIEFGPDRLGHDKLYNIDDSKIRKNLNWRPLISLDTGLKKTVEWYLNNHEMVYE